MASLADLVVVNTATAGTGTMTLGAAVAPYLTMAGAGAINGQTYSYSIIDGTTNSEVGRGTWSSGASTLTRGPLWSTNGNAAISLSGSAVVRISALAEDFAVPVEPGGRLTLASGTPVMISTASGQATVFYTPYRHQFVPIYNGTYFVNTDTGGEISQATTDAAKSPAAVAANSIYDVFAWNDAGTIRATRGPAWSSSSSRGSGAGTSQLTQVKGVWVNANAIANGPGANLGTYVGTIASNASSTIDFTLGAAASGGTAAVIHVWNMYNRVSLGTTVTDTGSTYTYTSATVRQARASAGNQISFVLGQQEDAVQFTYNGRVTTTAAAGAVPGFGIGADSVSAFGLQPMFVMDPTSATSATGSGCSTGLWPAGVGTHVLAALEAGDGTNANTFDAGLSNSLMATIRM